MPRALGILGRTLLRVARAEAAGVLTLGDSGTDHVSLLFEKGMLVAFSERRQRTRPLDATGRTSLGQRRFLVRILTTHASRPGVVAHFRVGQELRDKVELLEPFGAIDVVVAVARKLPLGAQAAAVLKSRWRLSPLGDALGHAPLSAPESALRGALERMGGARGDELVAVSGGHAALKTLVAWRDLGLVRPHARSGSCGQLLRATRAMRQGDGLPQSKRKRRRLAATFHPDRFDEELTKSSRAVMEALLRGD